MTTVDIIIQIVCLFADEKKDGPKHAQVLLYPK